MNKESSTSLMLRSLGWPIYWKVVAPLGKKNYQQPRL